MEIGIVGFGRFGRLAAKVLTKNFQVSVYDRRKSRCPKGIHWCPLRLVATKPIVILCVPISEVSQTCLAIKPFLHAGQLIVDTCSVKEIPLEQMARLLPKFVDILGTHPLFGPETARHGVRGFKIVLCPVRCKRLPEIKRYLRAQQLDVIVTTAAEHDRAMARSQALFHFLAKGIAQTGIEIGRISTPGPAKLFRDLKDVQNDSVQLFTDLQTLNRYAAKVRKKLLRELSGLEAKLSGGVRKQRIASRKT